MPALVAKRWNPCLAAFAARLKAKGKSTPAILGAISHKMLRILVGMLRSNSNFDPNWSPQKI
jgi:transposase